MMTVIVRPETDLWLDVSSAARLMLFALILWLLALPGSRFTGIVWLLRLASCGLALRSCVSFSDEIFVDVRWKVWRHLTLLLPTIDGFVSLCLSCWTVYLLGWRRTIVKFLAAGLLLASVTSLVPFIIGFGGWRAAEPITIGVRGSPMAMTFLKDQSPNGFGSALSWLILPWVDGGVPEPDNRNLFVARSSDNDVLYPLWLHFAAAVLTLACWLGLISVAWRTAGRRRP